MPTHHHDSTIMYLQTKTAEQIITPTLPQAPSMRHYLVISSFCNIGVAKFLTSTSVR